MGDGRVESAPGRGTGAQRGLLFGALAWAALLVVLSAALPVYTVPSSQGSFQPRETVLVAYGSVALLPTAGLLILGAAVGVLLRRRRRNCTTTARAIGIVVHVASFGSVVALHLVGLLILPFGALLLAAVYAPAAR